MNKNINILVYLFVVIVTLCACRGGLYMEDFVDVQWTCSNMDMKFTYTVDNEGTAVGTIVKDNETINIVCMYTASKNIEIYDKLEYDSTTIDGIVCEPLIIGHYEIKDDIAVVTIFEDTLFNGEYLDKVIYLEKTPLIDSSDTD